jgi:hypothetical protein
MILISNSKTKTGYNKTMMMPDFAIAHPSHIADVSGHYNTEPIMIIIERNIQACGLVTLRQLLLTWVVHDLGHISQITRFMAKQYKVEVAH